MGEPPAFPTIEARKGFIRLAQFRPDVSKVQRAAAWSEAAYREVYSRYIKPLYAYVQRRVRNHHDAEDVTAEVFVQAFDHLDPKEPSSPELAKWLFTSARNATVNHARKRKFIATVSIEELPDAAEDADPAGAAVESDDVERLLAAIERLPEEQRRALVLRFVEELPHSEIAEILGRSETSARVLLHRTVAELRRRIS